MSIINASDMYIVEEPAMYVIVYCYLILSVRKNLLLYPGTHSLSVLNIQPDLDMNNNCK